MGASTNTEVIDFSAGMNTVKAPHLIARNESRALINVNIKNGSLLSMPVLYFVEIGTNEYFVEFLNQLWYYANFRTNAFMDNNMYWADGITTGKVLYDGRELPLGIAPPTLEATMSIAGIAPNGTHTGDFKYTYTFYSTDTGVESAPAPLPPYLTVDKDDIIISGLEPLPTEADRYRIYRIGGYLPRFTLVDEIEVAELPYTDSLDDTEIDGRLLQTLHCGAPLDGMNDFVELNGRLFGSVGAKVYFSALGNPDAWYQSDFFTMPDDITGMAKSPAGLLVFGRSYTYLLVGTAPTNFRLKVISNILGCASRESIAYINENAIWLSETGICTSNGYQIKDLTSDKIESVAHISPTSAEVLNEVYYLSFKPSISPTDELFPADDLYPGGALGTSDLEDGIINMDFKRGTGYSYNMYDYKNIASLGIVGGELNIMTANPDVIFLPCDEPLLCDATLVCSYYSLNVLDKLVGNDYEELRYVSPTFIDGSYSTLKQYDKIRLNMRGSFNVKVIFSDGSIAIEEDIKVEDNVNIVDGHIVASDNVTIMGIPNQENSSYSIGFIISGVGVINSIQYSWKPREMSN